MEVTKLFTLPMLLILCGDVELNPGPLPKVTRISSVTVSRAPRSDGSRVSVVFTDQMSEKEILAYAHTFTEADWSYIGHDLGYNAQELNNLRRRCPRLRDAFFLMIKMWRDNGGVRKPGGSVYVKKLTMTFNRSPPSKRKLFFSYTVDVVRLHINFMMSKFADFSSPILCTFSS
nr:uncharacterized protein LOC129267035 [Lytechinus pictus]